MAAFTAAPMRTAIAIYSYRLNDQYQYTTGLPSNIERSKLTNP